MSTPPAASPTTPSSASRPRPPPDTPARRDSGSVRLHSLSADDNPPSSTKRTSLDLLLRDELEGHVQTNIDGFFSRFPPSTSNRVWNHAVQRGLYREAEKKWAGWPSTPTEKAVSEWFHRTFGVLLPLSFQLQDHVGPPPCRFVSSGHLPVQGGDCVRKTDLALTTTLSIPNEPPDRHLHWASVRVVGELKQNPAESDKTSTLLQLANYVREVFGVQHSRRYVHAFTLCGTKFRAWLFSRSGVSASCVADIHENPELFVRVICAYATMGATAIGFDPTIKYMQDGLLKEYDSTWFHRLTASSSSPALDNPYISVPILRSAPHRKGPLRLTIDRVPLGSRYAIVSRGTVIWKATGDDGREFIVKDQWRAEERPSEGELLMLIGPGICGLPQYEWHGDVVDHENDSNEFTMAPTVRHEPHHPPLPHGETAAPTPVHTTGRKRSLREEEQPPKKRSKGASDKTQNQLAKRIHTRLVLFPVGRPLWKATSWTQLLQALHDAIRGHRYLFQSLGIIHRDVSIGNVLLAPSGYHCTGVLIDLDMAIHRDRVTASGAAHRTGTIDFMAAEVLLAQAVHNPLHDLESFLYVLIWIFTFYDLSSTSNSPLREPKANPLFPRDAGSRRNRLTTLGATKEGLMRTAKTFRMNVLPALVPLGAHHGTLSTVLLQWRKALFRPTDDEDEDVEEEDGFPLDEYIDEVYTTVLQILERGMDALQEPR